MSTDKAISEIRFEIEQIERLLHSYKSLFEKCKVSQPDLVEVTAMASVLHSFYNGIENLFIRIAKQIDGDEPTGHQWHRDLLKQMNIATGNRHRKVISNKTLSSLLEYLGFRHFYRHAYSYTLDWSEMKRLVLGLESGWESVKGDVETFLEAL